MQVFSCQRCAALVALPRSGERRHRAPGCKSGSADVTRFGLASAPSRGRGFTLIELMITMAVALVLIMIAVPSFKNIILSSKLTTTANEVVGSINLARMEAIKRNANTQLCSDLATNNTTDTLGTACGTQAGAVYALSGGATPSAVAVQTVVAGIVPPLQLNGHITALRFGGRGLAQVVGPSTPTSPVLVADICTGSISNNNHRLIYMTAGSILSTTTSSGACP
jgi:type IV fimbrial biogenesis protein FimT